MKDGKGTISSQSGVLKDTQYSFSTRFENGIGTNPEELIAAAHAGCFTMALSAQLGNANLTPESLETTADVKFEKLRVWRVDPFPSADGDAAPHAAAVVLSLRALSYTPERWGQFWSKVDRWGFPVAA